MTDIPGTDNDSTGEYAELRPGSFPPRVRLEFAALTHPGLARENNEDNFVAARLSRSIAVEAGSLPDPDDGEGPESSRPGEGHLILLADGMGGVAGGERASALAVEAVLSFLLHGFRSFLHAERTDEAAVLRELRAGFDRADRIVLDWATSDPTLAGMGTTLTMAYGTSTSLYILHAGDSRAYLHRGGELRQVTTDHTLVQMMLASGTISAEDAKIHPNRNVVTNVIGGPGEGVHAEVIKIDLRDGDLVLLCSDGLTEPVDDPTIAAILAREPDPKAAADALLREALDRGGPDNITLVLALVHVGP